MSNLLKIMIYDCEIKKAILGRREVVVPNIDYCDGWHDFPGMGISVIGVYDYEEDRYRVFMGDNLHEFKSMVDSYDLIVGFNSLSFDNALCAANGIFVKPEKSYDILVELWQGLGLSPTFNYRTHGGFSLDAMCIANFGSGKTNSGANAPYMYQRGQIGALIDYCIDDIRWTKRLFDKILLDGHLVSAKNRSEIIWVRDPF